ncbi:hypothetical protein [Haloferula sp. BvORR071]|uniref:hypothetical protein n=1 Tax=Haloferula sp. BvORR071 TaxID=1396141 RepID=UPI0005562D0F|nr:hypothetical protein [Haloferula sp. BvORR071]
MKLRARPSSWLPLCLGLPGFLFLAWAWVYSNYQTSDLNYRPWGFEASSCEGHLVMAGLSPEAQAFHAVDHWEGVVYEMKVPNIPPPPPLSPDEELPIKWTQGVVISCDFGGTWAPHQRTSLSPSPRFTHCAGLGGRRSGSSVQRIRPPSSGSWHCRIGD